jgi:hypothetical protein
VRDRSPQASSCADGGGSVKSGMRGPQLPAAAPFFSAAPMLEAESISGCGGGGSSLLVVVPVPWEAWSPLVANGLPAGPAGAGGPAALEAAVAASRDSIGKSGPRYSPAVQPCRYANARSLLLLVITVLVLAGRRLPVAWPRRRQLSKAAQMWPRSEAPAAEPYSQASDVSHPSHDKQAHL